MNKTRQHNERRVPRVPGMVLKNLNHVVPAPCVSTVQAPANSKATDENNHRCATTWRRRTTNVGRQLVSSYNKLQIGHRGLYSIERLKAFQTYSEKTSVLRAVAVCVLTPVPSLLTVIILECIPVRAPEDGWQVNIGFWIRFFLSGLIIIVCSTYQITDMVDRLRISTMQCLGIGVGVMGVYVAALMTIANLWVFPVPFGIVLGIGPCWIAYITVLVLTIGHKTFVKNPGLVQEMKFQFYVLGAEAIVAFIYPAFTGVYIKANSTQRAGLVMLLPLTKIIMKNVVAWSCSHLEDYVPVIAVFSIEVFNALYVATCMQSTKSTLATTVIIVFDVVNGGLTFYSLIKRTQAIHKQREELMTDSVQLCHATEKLLPTVTTASQSLRTFKTQRGTVIRVHAPLRIQLGVETQRVLGSLAGHLLSFEEREAKCSHCTKRSIVPTFPIETECSFQPDSTSPAALKEDNIASAQPPEISNSRENQKLELVESTLQLLFQSEYHALVEYVECAVPVVFGIYSTILCELPSHKYYPLTRDMVPGQLESMLTSLAIYVLLEVLSFVVMHIALKRKFKLSALYQLAFVLETHFVQIQSRLLFWIVFILQFTLQHYGVDFTFQFAWIQ